MDVDKSRDQFYYGSGETCVLDERKSGTYEESEFLDRLCDIFDI